MARFQLINVVFVIGHAINNIIMTYNEFYLKINQKFDILNVGYFCNSIAFSSILCEYIYKYKNKMPQKYQIDTKLLNEK